MKSKVAKNYLFNLSYQALLALVPLITQPYVSRVLGPEYLGQYSYTQSIVTYFTLLGALGVNVYGQREIAFVQEDKDKRSKIFFELVFLKTFSVGISVILYMFIFANVKEYSVLFLIQCLDLIATALDITWFFQGLEEFKKIAVRNSVVKAAGVIFVFIFVKSPKDLPIYVFIYSLTLLLGNALLWLYLPYYINKESCHSLNIKKYLKPTLWLFIPQVATSIYTVLDKTMIGIIINDTTGIGIYDYVQKIINLLLTVITSMGTVMLPRVSNYFANGNRRELEKSIDNSILFVFLLSFPMIAGVFVVADLFSLVFWGPSFQGAGKIMRIMCIILLLVGLSNVTGTQYMVPTGKEKQFSLSIITGSITNFLLNMIFIRWLGVYGACIASVIAELVILSVQVFIVRKELPIIHMIKNSKKYIIASLIMAIIIKNIRLPFKDIITLVLQIFIGMVLYIIMLVVLKETLVSKAIIIIKEHIYARKKS